MALRFAGAALALSAATTVLATLPSAPSTSPADCPSLLQRKKSDSSSSASLWEGAADPGAEFKASFKPLIVIPGLGEAERVPNVLRNLQLFKSFLGGNFSCRLFIWKQEAALDPLFEASRFAPCRVTYAGTQLFEAIKKVPEHDLGEEVSHVFLLLDDIRLQPQTLQNLHSFASTHATDATSVSYSQSWCDLMKPLPNEHGDLAVLSGRGSTYMEINSILFSTSVYRCFQELIDPVTNVMGYGYDFILGKLCARRPAICDDCLVESYNQTEAARQLQEFVLAHQSYAEFRSDCDESSIYEL